ncbi:cell division topological specificity factor [Methylomarinovum tepidoasis]|uniref:Cell division topological specificity factor n=1 Tax=Methylomarinovum tepidoasis TaxID=2840183 RepID=A0AAU9CE36_9GAMM|nr:cell division topological specificity factor MinE [Methylomarinovum sp. IN45]BCX89056.1 cell division topological specificity factor [Methylomarinovum sp. IN45]
MGLLNYFRSSRPKSAQVAKERLQILVAHERKLRDAPSYLPQMQQEILAVIRKYVAVDDDAISIQMEQDAEHEILEVNIVLPEDGTGGKVHSQPLR